MFLDYSSTGVKAQNMRDTEFLEVARRGRSLACLTAYARM
jgi:hypothetical protein